MSRSRSGYTLIELVVVILLLAMFMGMAITKVDFMVPKYTLRAGAREVAAILKQARSRASATGRDIYVRIYVSEQKYELLVPFEKPNPSLSLFPPDTPPEQLPPKEWEFQPMMTKSLPKEVRFVNVILGREPDQTFASGTLTVRMTPYGLGNHMILNLQLHERRMAVRLNGLTGFTSFYEDELKPDDFLEDTGE